jgi:hypothetical protein
MSSQTQCSNGRTRSWFETSLTPAPTSQRRQELTDNGATEPLMHRCYTPPQQKVVYIYTGKAVLEFGIVLLGSVFFCWGGGDGALTNIQVFGFIFVIFTQFTQKCIANDICDGGGGAFFHFPPGGVHKQKGW